MIFRYDYIFRPRHSDFDEYKIDHHSKYLCWFEEARYEAFGSLGECSEELIARYKLPVTRLDCKYCRAVDSFEEKKITVTVDVPLKTPVLHISYRLTDALGKKLYAKGYTEHTFVDSDLRMLNCVPEELENIVKKILKQEELQL